MKKCFSFFILLLTAINISNAQSVFNIVGEKKSITIPFKLVNNLILLPIKLNGQELTFILDTGVSNSLLFNIKTNETIFLKQTEKIRIKGLGKDVYFDALKSSNNLFRLKNIISPNFEISLILDKEFDFSARMGTDINGLIGTDFLRNFVVEINYKKKKLKISNPKYYNYKKCNKCEEFDLLFQNRKPYIDAIISSTDTNTGIPVKLLIDSGSGEALWLFEDSNEKIKIPKNSFPDFLGKGLSGNIFGEKGKLNSLELKRFKMENLLVSYPDSTSIFYINKRIKRNGTLGSEILTRFCIILDYPNNKITLKKTSNFKKPFYYDKSGLEIIHNGKMLIKETNLITTFRKQDDNDPILSYAYKFKFKNSYVISLVKENSPALLAGLKVNDVILEINNKKVFEYSLQEIIQKLSSENGKNIKFLIDRNGFEHTFRFKLKDML